MQVKDILQIKDLEQKKLALSELCEKTYETKEIPFADFLILLKDNERDIRLETALFLDQMEFIIPKEEKFWFEFALENFEFVVKNALKNEEARKVLHFGLKDKNERVRKQILKFFLLENCQNELEEVLIFYARGDYNELLEKFSFENYKNHVAEILAFGVEINTDYNKKKCLECLDILKLPLPQKEKTELKLVKIEKSKPDEEPLETESKTEFEAFLVKLEKKGIILDGTKVFPKIQIGTITNRVTYKNPGLQTLPKEDKLTRISPSENYKFLRFDFSQFEPRIFYEFALRRFLISPAEIPQDDVYKIEGIERAKVKEIVNKLINGGYFPAHLNSNPFLQKFINLVNLFKEEVSIEARENGFVTTIDGKEIPILQDETNFSGKAVNRIVQSSASDIFNGTVLELGKFLAEKNSQVAFLIYDEVWVEIPLETDAEIFAKEVCNFMETFAKQRFLLLVDLKVNCN
ncbi:hypothetical protein IT568_01620 [bacterium]|nr:hypothetical protein [bacterium]